MSAQIVEIGGEKMAVLPIADYERLLALAEDKADFEAAARAEQRRADGEEYFPSELVDRIIAGESPLRVWRKYRGLNLKELAAKSGVWYSYISELERGRKPGSGQAWGKLARALDVIVEDILPDEEN